jgi:hypothetical protein
LLLIMNFTWSGAASACRPQRGCPVLNVIAYDMDTRASLKLGSSAEACQCSMKPRCQRSVQSDNRSTASRENFLYVFKGARSAPRASWRAALDLDARTGIGRDGGGPRRSGRARCARGTLTAAGLAAPP